MGRGLTKLSLFILILPNLEIPFKLEQLGRQSYTYKISWNYSKKNDGIEKPTNWDHSSTFIAYMVKT
jgi:hypothetical protein